MLPESGGADQAITAVFDAARRRALMRHSLQGVAVALLALAALALVIPPSRRVLVIFAAGAGAAVIAFLRVRRSERTPRALAASLESRRPDLQNLAVTAEELLRHPDRAAGMGTRAGVRRRRSSAATCPRQRAVARRSSRGRRCRGRSRGGGVIRTGSARRRRARRANAGASKGECGRRHRSPADAAGLHAQARCSTPEPRAPGSDRGHSSRA